MATSFPGIYGYSSAFNSPVNLSDPLGDCPTCPVGGNEGDIWNYMGQLFRNIGGKWIASGPETVVTAASLGDFLVHDVLNTRFVSSGFWQLTNRPNNELSYLQGQVPISIEPISGPDRTKALFTHYKTPQDRAREATIDYYKDVDFAHGQLMPPRSWIWDLIFGARKAFNGQYVGENGYPLPPAQQAIQRQAEADIALFSMIDGPGELDLPLQWHHFATNKNLLWTPKMEAIAERFGLDLNEDWNIAKLPHRGRHPNDYHEFVFQKMQQAANEAGNSRAKFLELFDKYIKQPVVQNPNLLRKSGW